MLPGPALISESQEGLGSSAAGDFVPFHVASPGLCGCGCNHGAAWEESSRDRALAGKWVEQ